MTAQLSTTGNETGHVILRGTKDGPNYSAAHIADTRAALRRRGLPEVLVVDASHGNSQKDHPRQPAVVHDLAGQIAGGETAIRGVMLESNLVAGRQDLDQRDPGSLEYGMSVTDSCVDLPTTEAMLEELAVGRPRSSGLSVPDADRPARVEDLHELALGMPHVTVVPGGARQPRLPGGRQVVRLLPHAAAGRRRPARPASATRTSSCCGSSPSRTSRRWCRTRARRSSPRRTSTATRRCWCAPAGWPS